MRGCHSIAMVIASSMLSHGSLSTILFSTSTRVSQLHEPLINAHRAVLAPLRIVQRVPTSSDWAGAAGGISIGIFSQIPKSLRTWRNVLATGM
jgi:hypothetical protein